MNIFNTHIHKLRFSIDKNAPTEFMTRWKKFKTKCETGNNKQIVEQIKDYCKLEQNKNLPYLNRSEGGLGGDNNLINKQIRFRYNYSILSNSSKSSKYNDNDNDIILDQIYNTDMEKWTYDELDDLIYAFVKTANYYVNADCVEGCIEMVNNNYESDESD